MQEAFNARPAQYLKVQKQDEKYNATRLATRSIDGLIGYPCLWQNARNA